MPTMGRTRRHNRKLPNRVYSRGASYYYVRPDGKWLRLCKIAAGQAAMHRALAELRDEARVEPTMRRVIRRYRDTVIPRKAPSTAQMQARQLTQLERVFGAMDAATVRPEHVAEFHDLRGQIAPVSANRELALLSHVMRLAIRMGHVPGGVNPCSTIERHKERARDRYVTHDEYNAVWHAASAPIRVLMDLAYLTGQRQADLIKLHRRQLTDDGILFEQAKTGKRLLIGYSPNLVQVLNAARALSTNPSVYVVPQPDGSPYGSSGIQTAWQRLMRHCVASGVIGERFTFHDLRAKAGSDDDDGRLLGHMTDAMRTRVYRRRAEKFDPVW